MDESGARALLERLAADEPPSRVDVAAARARGRRQRWRRLLMLSTTPLAAVSAAAALAATGVIPLGAVSRGPGRSEPAQSRAAATPRSQFDVLVPYATFGQLPAGFSASAGAAAGDRPYSTSTMLVLGAVSPSTGHVLNLEVYPAGVCSFRSDMLASQIHAVALPPEYYIKRYHRRLAGACDGLPLAKTAPAVDGGRAFWTPGGGLAWEYAPGGWAAMQPRGEVTSTSGSAFRRQRYNDAVGWRNGITLAGHPPTTQSAASRALLLSVAAGMRYGQRTPVLFGFHLTGLPGVWQPQSAQYTASGNLLLGSDLRLSSASSSYFLDISVSPVGAAAQACQYVPGLPVSRETTLTLGGTSWILTMIPGEGGQTLCAANYHGLAVTVDLSPERPFSGSKPPVTLAHVVRHLGLLGPNPATWTPNPLG